MEEIMQITKSVFVRRQIGLRLMVSFPSPP